jgi:hypothetical protein
MILDIYTTASGVAEINWILNKLEIEKTNVSVENGDHVYIDLNNNNVEILLTYLLDLRLYSSEHPGIMRSKIEINTIENIPS